MLKQMYHAYTYVNRKPAKNETLQTELITYQRN